jgi:hypothetical protein
MAMTWKRFWAPALAAGCALAGMTAGDLARADSTTAYTWKRWEHPLNAGVTRTPLQSYHDVQVEATFWVKGGATCTEPAEGACTSTNTCFKGLAFWDGTTSSPGTFKVRSTFPTGNWCWKTCLLPKTRPDPNQPSLCTGDSGLNQSGDISVNPDPSATSPLYSNGLLKAPAGKRNLTYWNGTTFFQWIGDTAWNAPINHPANPSLWTGYVTKRANAFTVPNQPRDGFTNILVAPASQTQNNPPAGGFKGFVTPSGCSSAVVPSSCHYWDSTYWQDFDQLVKDANDQGIVVVVAGVMDPLNRGGSNQNLNPVVPFPTSADATAFARNLAARLAGNHVVFSPSFDTRAADATAQSGLNAAGLISAVGSAIRTAAPRHLIGVHLAGGSALGDYDQFQGQSWMSLQVFQSGHHAGTCVTGLANDYANFACRARAFSLRFRCIGDTTGNPTCTGSGAPAGLTLKPAVNVEGQYETLGDNETRVQTRHTAWNSGLSGSFGFNIGVYPDITTWSNPLAYNAANHLSDDDLSRMKGLFKALPWTELKPRHDLLVEQNNSVPAICPGPNGVNGKADWLQLWKPLLAIDATGRYMLAYLPRPTPCTHSGSPQYNPTTSIVLNNSSLGIVCNQWTAKWISPGSTAAPGGFPDATAGCNVSGSTVTFSVKTNTVTCGAACDRVLQLTKKVTGSNNSPIVASGSAVDLELGVALSDDGQTSTITGLTIRNGLSLGGGFPLSGTNAAFRKLPSAALDAAGNFLVAWEEENADGTDDVVAARFDNKLRPLGSLFVLNDTTEGQQSEPWVSGDDSGNTVAVWTNYSDDDTIAGDIYGKVLDSSGAPLGPEFLISTDDLGNQIDPQVQMEGGGDFVVAWTEDATGDPPPGSLVAGAAKARTLAKTRGGVYYRVYGSDGQPRDAARHVDTGNPGRDRLSRIEPQRHGGFRLHVRSFDAGGHDLGEHEEDCDREGNPIGNH